jgi:pyruvate/2-oxoglutarate dehydrogenase complex dihydrolipoamide dehydrogenase (E3) component
VIVATGASPSMPPICGIESTSTTAMELERLPNSLLVIRGGYIGCELGQMFARAAVAVTIVDIQPILAVGEPEISGALASYLRDEGIAIWENVETRAIRTTTRGIALDFSADGRRETIVAEQVLIATGRRPNTEGIALREAGIALSPSGGIQVNEWMQTTNPGSTPPAMSPAATNSSTWPRTGPRSRPKMR